MAGETMDPNYKELEIERWSNDEIVLICIFYIKVAEVKFGFSVFRCKDMQDEYFTIFPWVSEKHRICVRVCHLVHMYVGIFYKGSFFCAIWPFVRMKTYF